DTPADAGRPAPAAPRLRPGLGDRELDVQGPLRPADRDPGLPPAPPAPRDAPGGRLPGQHGPRLPPGPGAELQPAPRRADGPARPGRRRPLNGGPSTGGLLLPGGARRW